MGFLGDFMGGAAEAGAGVIGNQIKLDQEADKQASLAKIQSDLAIEREKTIEALKVEAANTARQTKSKAIQSQLESNADADVATKFSGVDQLPDDATPEAKAAYDKGVGIINAAQGKAKSDFMGNARNAAMAEAQTGYGDYDKVAALDQRSDASANLLLGKMNHDDTLAANNINSNLTREQIAASDRQTKLLIAQLAKGNQSEKADASEKLTTQLNAITRITNDMINSGDDKKNPARYKALQDQQDEILGTLKSKRSGDSSPAPASSIASPKSQAEFAALPSGSIYINPADGKQYRKK